MNEEEKRIIKRQESVSPTFLYRQDIPLNDVEEKIKDDEQD